MTATQRKLSARPGAKAGQRRALSARGRSSASQAAAERNLDAAYEGKEHGEGNYKAAKQYGKAVGAFVRSGRVERAAAQAAPRSPGEARALDAAENRGRARSKGEDPSLGGAKRKRAN